MVLPSVPATKFSVLAVAIAGSAAHARLADSAMPLRGTTGRLRQQQRMARLGSKQRTIADGPPDDALAP